MTAVVVGLEWRYLYGRRVKHALSDGFARQAVCGQGPHWSAPDGWYGTGSQAEYETVAALPECKRCVARVGAR